MSVALARPTANDQGCDPWDLSRLWSTFFSIKVSAASGPVLDVVSPFEAERLLVQNALPKRRREFFSGRYYARQALHADEQATHEILRGVKGNPLWPLGLHGSLSHDGDYVIAAITSDPCVNGWGIDFHHHTNIVSDDLISILCNDGETNTLTHYVAESQILAALFSVKEAVAKALSPHISEYLEFRQVRLFRDGQALQATVDGYAITMRCCIMVTPFGIVSAALF